MQATSPRTDNPFHAGELAIHERLGIAERMQGIGRKVVRNFMPEQHQRFYEQLPMMMTGAVDPQGRPWATMLVGQAGFMQARGERQLDVRARPIAGDPAAAGMGPGARLGFLGIELHTRRRNRMNGQVLSTGPEGLSVQVDQTIGNCPQYIQGREFGWVRDAADTRPRSTETFSKFDSATREFIERADTLFLATHAPAAAGEAARGADVSHRGGRPGFVKVESERSFIVPDFTGNFMFMSFGNLELDARAGVLFVDFDSGDLLTLTGRATVIWDGPELAEFVGAERAWRFELDEAHWLRDALPLRWAFRDWSPNSLLAGTWAEAQGRQQAKALAASWRPYRVSRVVDESALIRSFHLDPTDGLPPPPFKAGQHLPIRLQTPGGVVQRSYTLSQAPSDAGLRLSVKREGVASRFLHEAVAVGDVIDARAPAGGFTIDPLDTRPAVLIGAGVGITPMMAFLRHVVTEGFRHRRTRPLHLIQVAHSAEARAFGAEIDALVVQAKGAVKVHLVLSTPAPGAIDGPFKAAMLKTLLPFDDHEFFLCGPAGFMQASYDGLRELGVRDERIRAEAFGPSGLRRRTERPAPEAPPVAARSSVSFQRSDDAAEWTPAHGSLLEFAEGKGISPPFS